VQACRTRNERVNLHLRASYFRLAHQRSNYMKSILTSVLLFTIVSHVSAAVPPTISYQGRVQVGGTNFTGSGQFKFALVSGGTNLNRQATATATVTSGFVTSITVTDGGFGYSAPPTVMINDSTGSGAMATAQVSGGAVTSITVNNAGSGYTAPSVVVAPPPPGTVVGTYWSNDGTSTGGSQPSSAVTVAVQGGLFTVILGDVALANMTPIPPEIFVNSDAHLRIWFNDGTQGFSQLTPDQPLTSVGYAMAANILPMSIGTASLADRAVTTVKLADGAVTGVQIADQTITANKLMMQTDYANIGEPLTLTNPLTPEGQFGLFVTRVGSRLFVGGSDESSNAVIYVFEGNGQFVGSFSAPATTDDGFGMGAAAVGSNRLVVGAPLRTTGSVTNSGVAYLFDTQTGGLLRTFTNPAPAELAGFGFGVAAIGTNKVLLTAPNAIFGNTNVGLGYVFDLSGSLLATLTNPIPQEGDAFGLSVAVLGDGRMAIGAPLADGGAPDSGMAHLYNANGSFFRTLTNPVVNEGAVFGVPVAALGANRLLIGCIRADEAGMDRGSVYVFNSLGTLLSTITNPTPVQEFGIPLTVLDENRLLVGNVFFETNINVVGLNNELLGSVPGASRYLNDGFGPPFAILPGNRVVIPNMNASNVSIFAFTDYVPGLIAEGVRGNSVGTGALIDGAVTTVKLADASVTAEKLGVGAVNTPNLADVSVTMEKLADGAVSASKLADGAVSAFKLEDGATRTELLDDDGIGSGLDADFLDGMDSTAFWKITGNAGTTAANFLGTTDNRALELKVNNMRALRLEPTLTSVVNVIGGSQNNFVAPGFIGATIGGGGGFDGVNYTNSIAGHFGTIAGGRNNRIRQQALVATIGGGDGNTISTNAHYSTIGGGNGNDIGTNSTTAVIAGGNDNNIGANSTSSTIGGGASNDIFNNAGGAVVGGGNNNNIDSFSGNSTIGGGSGNNIGTNAVFAVIAGGFNNTIRPNSSTAVVAGGEGNIATNRAFAAGTGARAVHSGSFVWSSPGLTDSTNDNSVTMRAPGGYRLFSATAPNGSGVFLAPGGGSWAIMSDRNAKENFEPVDAQAVLDKVAALPMTTWNYKTQTNGARHMGPMAQDFKAAFGVGETDTGITTVDADGVALAAIQGLNERLKAEIETLKADLKELKQTVTELRERQK
jgi:hypothetical protein